MNALILLDSLVHSTNPGVAASSMAASLLVGCVTVLIASCVPWVDLSSKHMETRLRRSATNATSGIAALVTCLANIGMRPASTVSLHSDDVVVGVTPSFVTATRDADQLQGGVTATQQDADAADDDDELGMSSRTQPYRGDGAGGDGRPRGRVVAATTDDTDGGYPADADDIDDAVVARAPAAIDKPADAGLHGAVDGGGLETHAPGRLPLLHSDVRAFLDTLTQDESSIRLLTAHVATEWRYSVWLRRVWWVGTLGWCRGVAPPASHVAMLSQLRTWIDTVVVLRRLLKIMIDVEAAIDDTHMTRNMVAMCSQDIWHIATAAHDLLLSGWRPACVACGVPLSAPCLTIRLIIAACNGRAHVSALLLSGLPIVSWRGLSGHSHDAAAKAEALEARLVSLRRSFYAARVKFVFHRDVSGPCALCVVLASGHVVAPSVRCALAGPPHRRAVDPCNACGGWRRRRGG